MSCGTHLNPRRKHMDPHTVMVAFGLPATTKPEDVMGSWWASEADATESVMHNRDDHGHGDAARGPIKWDGGWATMVDIGMILARTPLRS
jgi:hypothetical protein